jgi:hypothetical protein
VSELPRSDDVPEIELFPLGFVRERLETLGVEFNAYAVGPFGFDYLAYEVHGLS